MRHRIIFKYKGTVMWGGQATRRLRDLADKFNIRINPTWPKVKTLAYIFKQLPVEGYENTLTVIKEPKRCKRSLYVAKLRQMGFNKPPKKKKKTTAPRVALFPPLPRMRLVERVR